MPSSPNYVRDYKQERKTAIKRGEVSGGPNGKNASRKKARRAMEKKLGKSALKGKDVDHIDRNPRNNSPKNLRVTSKSKNRSIKRK